MSEWGGNYQDGRPYGQCDRCDRKKRLDELRVDWTGSKVCRKCFDPRPVELTPPKVDPKEGAAIPGARPMYIPEATDEQLAFPYRDGTTFDPDNPTKL